METSSLTRLGTKWQPQTFACRSTSRTTTRISCSLAPEERTKSHARGSLMSRQSELLLRMLGKSTFKKALRLEALNPSRQATIESCNPNDPELLPKAVRPAPL